MAIQNWDVESLITYNDETGELVAPNHRQLVDKNLRELYFRDKSEDKIRYRDEVLVIWFVADPKSPANEDGCGFEEAVSRAITYFDLPPTFAVDDLMLKIIHEYQRRKITEAGKLVLVLKQGLHTSVTIAEAMIKVLNDKIRTGVGPEDMTAISGIIREFNKMIGDTPNLIKKLDEAYDNLLHEQETEIGYGKQVVTSSMNANEYV